MMATSSKQMQMDTFVRDIKDLESALRNKRNHCKANMTSN